MDKKPIKLVVIIEESVVGSLIKDIFTGLLFGGLLYFNHAYLSGSTLIDILFIFLVIMLLVAKSSNYLYKGKLSDAIKFLEDKKNS